MDLSERFSGEGTWNREARRVTLLAAELGGVLDKETLILCDVRDLMALRLGLQRALAGEGRHTWAIVRVPFTVARPLGLRVANALDRIAPLELQ